MAFIAPVLFASARSSALSANASVSTRPTSIKSQQCSFLGERFAARASFAPVVFSVPRLFVVCHGPPGHGHGNGQSSGPLTFVDEMRAIAMKLHTKSQAKEGEAKEDSIPLSEPQDEDEEEEEEDDEEEEEDDDELYEQFQGKIFFMGEDGEIELDLDEDENEDEDEEDEDFDEEEDEYIAGILAEGDEDEEDEDEDIDEEDEDDWDWEILDEDEEEEEQVDQGKEQVEELKIVGEESAAPGEDSELAQRNKAAVAAFMSSLSPELRRSVQSQVKTPKLLIESETLTGGGAEGDEERESSPSLPALLEEVAPRSCGYREVEFVKSAYMKDSWPTIRNERNQSLPEVAVAGRANAGKSSLLNDLWQKPDLAKASNFPGQTRSLDFFTVDRQLAFIDIPGYGFSKVTEEEREQWPYMFNALFNERKQLKMILLLVDMTHSPDVHDAAIAEWIRISKKPAILVCTKADMVRRELWPERIKDIRQRLKWPSKYVSVPYSIFVESGREELRKFVDYFLLKVPYPEHEKSQADAEKRRADALLANEAESDRSREEAPKKSMLEELLSKKEVTRRPRLNRRR